MSPPPTPQVTACVLLYGDYPQLAARCLGPRLLALAKSQDIELRVATNAIGKNTDRFLRDVWGRGLIAKIYKNEQNRNKYPVMRDMFHDPDRPITTPYIMWFDDDSCLVDNGMPPQAWLNLALGQMDGVAQLGSTYTMHLVGNQHLWMRDQPWYTGRVDLQREHNCRFCTGGWWITRTELIQQFNWPIPELNHNGGDLLYSQILQQQGLRLKRFNSGVWINADDKGKESNAPRRGTDHRRTPIGWDYKPQGEPATLPKPNGPTPITPPIPPRTITFDLDL
jgi:hypothetical protein